MVELLERLPVTQQHGATGERLAILPWQKKLGSRHRREPAQVARSRSARGNGKTTICAGLAVASLDRPA